MHISGYTRIPTSSLRGGTGQPQICRRPFIASSLASLRPLFYAPPVQTINNTIESYPFQPLPNCPVTVTVNDDDTIYVLEEEESHTTLWRHKAVMCVATPVRPFRDRDLPLVLHLNILVAYFGVEKMYSGI